VIAHKTPLAFLSYALDDDGHKLWGEWNGGEEIRCPKEPRTVVVDAMPRDQYTAILPVAEC
jgi:hypothetical protein